MWGRQRRMWKAKGLRQKCQLPPRQGLIEIGSQVFHPHFLGIPAQFMSYPDARSHTTPLALRMA